MTTSLSRREAMKVGAAFVLGFYLPGHGQEPVSHNSDVFKPNAWVRITRDNRITVLTEIPEMGQGTRTANVMMLADELEVEWSSIQWEQAPTIPETYKHLSTGGSGGTAATWLPMRKAGAQARELFLAAAAQHWGVDKKDCKAENGAVIHSPSKRRLLYGELVKTAAKIPVVSLDQVPLKDAKDFCFIGKPMGRVDTPAKTDGTAIFGIDVRVPEMLFAVIARCPYFGGKVASCDDSAAKATAGVKAVFAVPPIGFVPAIKRNLNVAGGIAVVASSTWAALQGRKALQITWGKGPGAQESTASLQEQLRERAAGPPTFVSADNGNAVQALASAARKVEADYEIPFQAHATMEPMNTTAHVREDGSIEVWTPTQIANIAQTQFAELAGIPPEKVT